MALRLVLLLVLVAVACQAQEEGGNPRQRLRALFNRRRAEGQTAADNVGNGAEGRSPFRLRRIRPRRPLTAEKREENENKEEEAAADQNPGQGGGERGVTGGERLHRVSGVERGRGFKCESKAVRQRKGSAEVQEAAKWES